MRQIEAPNRKLKWMQKGIKAQLETLFEAEPGAHGFVPGAPFNRMPVCTWGSGTCSTSTSLDSSRQIKRGRVQTVLQLDPIRLSKPAARISGRILYAQPRPATRRANVADVDEFGLHAARPQAGEARTSLPLPVLSLRGRHHHFRPQQGTDAPLARTHHQNPQNRGLPGARKQDPHPPDQPTARSHRPLRPRLCEFTANVPPTPARSAAHVAVQEALKPQCNPSRSRTKRSSSPSSAGRLQHAQHTNNTAEVQRMRTTFHQLTA